VREVSVRRRNVTAGCVAVVAIGCGSRTGVFELDRSPSDGEVATPDAGIATPDGGHDADREGALEHMHGVPARFVEAVEVVISL
jgi:hypothetical protein